MPRIQIGVRDDDRPELEAFLGDRLYQFNSRTTGIDDGKLLNASIEDAAGNIVAALSGHTWGGCCEIGRLWVDESMRGTGLGTALMQAAEREAVRRGCHQIVLSTHSFQAPQLLGGWHSPEHPQLGEYHGGRPVLRATDLVDHVLPRPVCGHDRAGHQSGRRRHARYPRSQACPAHVKRSSIGRLLWRRSYQLRYSSRARILALWRSRSFARFSI
jgi:GNAT superfamily N-acetyltransferase